MAVHPTSGDDDLVRIRVRGDALRSVASASLRAAAIELGYSEADGDRLADAVGLSCDAVCAHAFDDPATAELDIGLREGPAGLIVRVSDEGLPFTLAHDTERTPLAARLVGGPVTRCFVEHADEGNAVELHLGPAPEGLDHLRATEDLGTEPVPDDLEVTVRALQRSDCESLARCVWRAYGYTYVADYLYHPDRVWKLIEDGWLHSFVALDDTGEVIGHIGMILEEPDHRVADMSLGLTDPRYRRHHVLQSLGVGLIDTVVEVGIVGSFAEAVTTHTITQRGSVRGGSVETGILLGFIPATMSYRGIAEDLGGNRQSAVLSYHVIGETPTRTVALPPRYADELRSAYARFGIDRPETDPAPGTGSTELRVEIEAPRRLATLAVSRAGADLVEVVEHHRRELCASGMELVYVELPLSDPGAAAAVDDLHAHGFFYGGVIPELRDGDILRLQYLDVDVDPSVIQLYTDEARRLLAFTLTDLGA